MVWLGKTIKRPLRAILQEKEGRGRYDQTLRQNRLEDLRGKTIASTQPPRLALTGESFIHTGRQRLRRVTRAVSR